MTLSPPWPLAPLDDLVQPGRSIAYGVLKPGPRTANGVPMLRVTDITSNRVDEFNIYPISQELSDEFQRTRLLGGEVLVSIQGTVGRVARVSDRLKGANVSRTLAVVPPALPELTDWLWVTLQTPQVQDQMRSLTGGTTRDSLNLRDLRIVEVPVAPIPEQRRVLEAIESYFSRLDDAMGTLGRARRKLKRYRASVLKAAVEGRLVPTEAELARTEGREYEPGFVLLERILVERRRRWEASGRKGTYEEPVAPDTSGLPELPEGWCWATVEQLTALVTKGTTPTSIGHSFASTGIRFVKVESLVGNHVDHDLCAYISEAADADLSRSRLEPSDVLFSIAGTLGRVAVVQEADVPANTNQAVAILRPVVPTLAPLLMWALQRPEMSQMIKDERRGVGLYNLNLRQVTSIPVPLPPEPEQIRIVAAIEEADSLAEATWQNIVLNSHRCSRLRQSVLKWAFEGKLADQDPSDEPASVLLERIKVAREAAQSITKKRTVRAHGRARATA